MAQRGKTLQALRDWLKTLNRSQHWCILISADPDAMGAAAALKRIMASRTSADIFRINEITRPDNLAMLRYLHLDIPLWEAGFQENYTHFAMVDSQPHHNKAFEGIPFSVVVDHHPLKKDVQWEVQPQFLDIRPRTGATCTIFCEYLRGLGLRPSPTLATAMTLGIRTDTALFERGGGQDDLNAYQWLSSRANQLLLRRIIRSEYLRTWLPLFTRAFRNLYECRGSGAHAWVGEVSSADLLVAIADFFTKVHGLKWVAVSGLVLKKTVVVIFRGDGGRDIGRLADACFHDVGTAGGHRTLGRAEFPVSAVPQGRTCMDFIQDRLQRRKLRPKKDKA